jgi:4-diphosphocytidyl-2-C-methyl-D-erythritol kinase
LAEQKELLVKAGALGAMLCGSGPSILGLCRDEDHAAAVAAAAERSFDRMVVAASRPVSVEPA